MENHVTNRAKVWGEAYEASRSQSSIEPLVQGLLRSDVTLDPSSTLVALPSAEERPYFYIGIYGAIALSGGLVSIFAAMTQYAGALKASRSMFELLLRNIVRATIRWYDVTPQGRILNRFSRVWSILYRRRFSIGLT